jgi:tetratricopeptide (TPR) repeat protein
LTERANIPDELLTGLREDIILRRIRSGVSRLDAQRQLIDEFDPAAPNAAPFAWRLAQWVDIGYRDDSLIHGLLGHFRKELRGSLSLRDYACLRMAEGMAAMSREESDCAIAHFDAVLSLQDDIGDREMLAIANFWKARSKRQKGEYDDAFTHTLKGRDIALECGFARMAAVMRVLESWLLFQKGKHKDALKTLVETEAALAETDDYVVLGNIQSTYGRIYRQEGRYDRAIHHFNRAIEEYRQLDGQHRNLARTLANMAYVKRLVALDFRRKIDAEVARRRHSPARTGPEWEMSQAQYRERFARLRDEAFGNLDEAAAIYRVHLNYRGSGTVHLDRGLLHLDSGELDLAGEEAATAYRLGEEKEDHILMARARILQCMVENAKIDEGIEEDPRRHAEAALEHIRDALEFARNTQNRRLLARAHTWHGLTLSNDFFNSHDAAMDAMNAANSYLDHGFHDTAWQDLRVLKARILKSNSVDETLQAWSQGAVGDKTFRQISDEFAEIIIPKVWEHEGRKVARVAAKLSISPKKVRRALIRAGLLRVKAARG